MKLTLFMVLATILSIQASAQSKMTEEQKSKYEAYKQKLNLTEEQSKKVDAINTTYFEGLGELKNSNASKLSKYKKFKSLNNEKDKQMKGVLTKEQFKMYKEYQAQMKEEFKDKRRQ